MTQTRTDRICRHLTEKDTCPKCSPAPEARQTVAETPRIPCDGCGIPIPEPGENPEPGALLCDACHGGD